MTLWLWVAFFGLLATLLAVDLGYVTRRPRIVTPREALLSNMIWVLAAAGTALAVFHVYQTDFLGLEQAVSRPIDQVALDGRTAMLQFLTGYVLETALSLDNIAVLVLLLHYFKIPDKHVARVLLWAVVISLLVRFVLIQVGAELLADYRWFTYALGAALVLAMLRALVMPDEQTDFNRRWSVRLVRSILPVTPEPVGQRLLVRAPDASGRTRLMMTPLMLVALSAGLTDVAYAVDSIPAVFSVTRDPFIAFSSNALAILALRSLYLTLVNVVGRFRFLRVSIVFILLYVAAKMFLVEYNADWTAVTLGVVAGVMTLGIGASAVWYRRHRARLAEAPGAVGEPRGDNELRPAPLADLAEGVDVTRRNLRKIAILIAGTVVVVVGALVVGPIPGPGGMIVVAFGLGILATEFIWAQRLLADLKNRTQALATRADTMAKGTPIWVVPLVVVGYFAGAGGLAWLLHRELGAKPFIILTIAAGMFLPIGYWAYRTVRRRWEGRRGAARTPGSPAPSDRPTP